MRLYATHKLNANLTLLDLPAFRYGTYGPRVSEESYFDKLFRKMVVYDYLADDGHTSVLHEAASALEIENPAFEILFPTDLEDYMHRSKFLARWQKVSHDYNYYIQRETKKRDKENPYAPYDPYDTEAWEHVPDFSRQRKNLPWQFDALNRDAQVFAGEVYELAKVGGEDENTDLFRAKVNSILVPDKVIYALNGNQAGLLENEINLINIKLDLDGYKLAHMFLNRAIDSLHKVKWNSEKLKKPASSTIRFGEELLVKLKNRIMETERRFILFADYDPEE